MELTEHILETVGLPSSFEIVDDVTEHPKMAEDGRDQTYPLKLVQEVLCWYPERAGRKACPLKERGPRYKLKRIVHRHRSSNKQTVGNNKVFKLLSD